MKGLELSEKFYKEYGEKMINDSFPHLKDYLAVGLMGSGSECLGFDDEFSRDHDFEPGFCIFLPDEDIVSSKEEFQLERAYAKLPKEFMGFSRNRLSPVGGNRHGVMRISDFFEKKVANKNGEIDLEGWFFISEQFLLESTNGKIFFDNYGLLTKIRENLRYLPEEVRLKKLAGNLVLMAQSGQYNYLRSVKRGETGAAALCLGEFINSALKTIFLLNKEYLPYYKWAFRKLKDLEKLSHLGPWLEYLISSPNDKKEAEKKKEIIEKIAEDIIGELKNQNLTAKDSTSLEDQAYEVNNKIQKEKIRNLNIMFAV